MINSLKNLENVEKFIFEYGSSGATYYNLFSISKMLAMTKNSIKSLKISP